MSRVSEALRRAAESQDPGTVNAAIGVIEPPTEATDFPAESIATEFALESAEGPVVSSEDLTVLSPPAAAALLTPVAPALTVVEPAVAAPAAPKKPSFDRVAIRYEGKTLFDADLLPQSREQYRRLAATLHHLQARQGIKVVMVTSALVGEGKTLTASNVALTLSQSYQKQVLLVDADLRRPSLQAVFGIKSDSGLTEGLTSLEDRPVQVHQVTPRLGILPAGRPTSDPIAALTSDRMRRLIEEARHTFDWIILDTPPVALITDANLVSAIADGTVVVVKAGRTPWEVVDRTVQAIGRERILGVVLNHVTVATQGYGYYNDEYYYGAAGNDARA